VSSERDDRAAGYVEHLGGGAGFFDVLRTYPERAIGVVAMGNATKYDVKRVAGGLASLVVARRHAMHGSGELARTPADSSGSPERFMIAVTVG
jgi:hypothetical protein